jgi:hypothetical protein
MNGTYIWLYALLLIYPTQFFGCQPPVKSSLSEKENRVAAMYRNRLQSEHSKILLEIKNQFKIPDKLWNDTLRTLAVWRRKDIVRLTALSGQPAILISEKDPVVNRVQALLRRLSINESQVEIQLTYKNFASPTTAVQKTINTYPYILHCLTINMPHFLSLTRGAQDAFIMHEAMHLLQYDSFEESYILGMLQACGIHQEVYDYHPALMQYRQHNEIRADLHAALTSPHAADTLITHLCPLLNTDTTYRHPSRDERYTPLAELADLFAANSSVS